MSKVIHVHLNAFNGPGNEISSGDFPSMSFTLLSKSSRIS